MNMLRPTISVVALLLCCSCAPVTAPADGSTERYAAILGSYSQQDDALRIEKLDAETARSFPRTSASRDLYVFVHPGYSLFFSGADEQKGMKYHGAKFSMLETQFLAESRFLNNVTRAGDIVILIVPGNYQNDSIAPHAYAGYLNALAAGPSVRYIPSTGSSNGTVSGEDMVSLFHFIDAVKASRVLVGGGYVGRCQREFYNQLTTYYDRNSTFILQEVSTISPDDVTAREAEDISTGIKRGDYHAVGNFLGRKLDEGVNTLSIPAAPAR